MKKEWLVWGGVALGAYWLFNHVATSLLAPTGLAPTPSAQMNQFTCPTGTHYVAYDVSVSGGGFCS